MCCKYLLFMVIGVLCMPRGLDCTCKDIYPDINTTKVAAMCTDHVVAGKQVYLDTSVARNMSFEAGTACTCYAQLQYGIFTIITNFTNDIGNTSCGSYVNMHADDHFSSNISCETNHSKPVFRDKANLTVTFMTTSTVTGDYCVNLKKDFCGDDEFQCADGTCILEIEVCDHSEECPDASDENNCGPTACNEGRVRCDNGTGCISPNQRCNGNRDCPDGSDESVKYCGNGTATNETSSTEAPYITITCVKLPDSTTTTAAPTTTTTATPTTPPPAEPTSTKSATSTSETTARVTSSSTSTVSPDTTNANVGMIVGIILGVIVVVAIVVGIIVWRCKRCQKIKKYAVQKVQRNWYRLHATHHKNPDNENGHAMRDTDTQRSST